MMWCVIKWYDVIFIDDENNDASFLFNNASTFSTLHFQTVDCLYIDDELLTKKTLLGTCKRLIIFVCLLGALFFYGFMRWCKYNTLKDSLPNWSTFTSIDFSRNIVTDIFLHVLLQGFFREFRFNLSFWTNFHSNFL